jgi:hypothetical protein
MGRGTLIALAALVLTASAKRLVGRYVIREDKGERTWTWGLAPR